jgi:uncharacterized protein YozE (UPF0346 family)
MLSFYDFYHFVVTKSKCVRPDEQTKFLELILYLLFCADSYILESLMLMLILALTLMLSFYDFYHFVLTKNKRIRPDEQTKFLELILY